MKIVTICHGGNIRSVALAFRLRAYHNHDAIPIGATANSPETLRMLCAWADQVIIVDNELRQYVPAEFNDKLYLCNIGPDIYGHCWNPDLQNKIAEVGVVKI